MKKKNMKKKNRIRGLAIGQVDLMAGIHIACRPKGHIYWHLYTLKRWNMTSPSRLNGNRWIKYFVFLAMCVKPPTRSSREKNPEAPTRVVGSFCNNAWTKCVFRSRSHKIQTNTLIYLYGMIFIQSISMLFTNDRCKNYDRQGTDCLDRRLFLDNRYTRRITKLYIHIYERQLISYFSPSYTRKDWNLRKCLIYRHSVGWIVLFAYSNVDGIFMIIHYYIKTIETNSSFGGVFFKWLYFIEVGEGIVWRVQRILRVHNR